jgi:hypothetical protein
MGCGCVCTNGGDKSGEVTKKYAISVLRTAELCHEVNRIYCALLGDTSQVPWNDAPEWQRDSAINGVMLHLTKPDASPAESHENWYAEKKERGWKYGVTKDPDKLEHPCMVPFDQLPAEQQLKDHLFRGVVHACTPFISPNDGTRRCWLGGFG